MKCVSAPNHQIKKDIDNKKDSIKIKDIFNRSYQICYPQQYVWKMMPITINSFFFSLFVWFFFVAGEDEPDNITNNPIETLNDIHKDFLLNGPVQISAPISIEPINLVCTQHEKNVQKTFTEFYYKKFG